ncbi:EpsG family protein [Pectobacterium polaris]|uniref:EpsG family protein n=1 Tax=Pectobacterium polaris TaxID=2042057 RepID=UPI0039C933D3|nr:hypothetical protein [Pectobacterium polaris]
MQYYITFLVLVSILLLLSSIYKEVSKLTFLSAVFITMIFSGLRYDAGNDFFTYLDMINGLFPYDKIEPIPKSLIVISSHLKSPWLFFLSTSVMYISSIYYFCTKLSSRPQFSFFLFCVMPLSLLTSMGYVRQFLAVGFFCVSLCHFMDGRKKISLLFFLISFMSHYSALFFFPVLLMYRIISSRKLPLAVYVIFISLSLLSSGIVELLVDYAGNYGAYIAGERFIESGKKIGYIVIGMFFWFYIFSRNIKSKNEIFLFNLYFLFSCGYALLMPFGEYIVRVMYFLFPIAYILFANTLVKNVNMRVVQSSGILITGVLLYFSTLYLAASNETRDFLTNYSISILR